MIQEKDLLKNKKFQLQFMWLASLFILLCLCGCGRKSDSLSFQSTSDPNTSLETRIAELEKHVTFRRKYVNLHFDLMFHDNGGGMIPGPSDWDFSIVAKVPKDTIQDWIPIGSKEVTVNDISWLEDLPGDIPIEGIGKWYADGRTVVGVDSENSIVAYHNSTSPRIYSVMNRSENEQKPNKD